MSDPPGRSCCLIAFATAFTALSTVFVAAIGSEVLLDLRIVLSWRETDASILETRVREVPGGKRSSWVPEIVFEHEVEDMLVRCVGFDGHSTLLSRAKADDAVTRFAVGSRHPAWVDPGNPTRAVLVRGIQAKYLLGSLIALGFFGVGATLLFAGSRRGGLEGAPTEGSRLALSLEPWGGRTAVPLLTLSFCLPWIAAPALMLDGGVSVDPEALVLLGVFGLLGLLAACAFVYVLLHWIRLRSTSVEVSESVLHAGQEARFAVEHAPRLGSLAGIDVLLVCEAPRRGARGGRSWSVVDTVALEGVEGTLRVPADASPSGSRQDAELRWMIRIVARCRVGPRFIADFPVVVAA